MDSKEKRMLLIEKLNLNESWSLDGIYAYKNSNILVQFIEPHEGTDYKHMIRAELVATFDRWSVSRYQETFENNEELNKIIEDLKDMMDLNPKTELLSEYYCYGDTYEIHCRNGCYSIVNDGGTETTPKYCPYCGKELIEEEIELLYDEDEY